jgi:hypothetical protein
MLKWTAHGGTEGDLTKFEVTRGMLVVPAVEDLELIVNPHAYR